MGNKTIPFQKSFLEGFFTNILNPKVAVFYLAFLPQFIKPGDPVLLKSIFLASIHYSMGIVWLGTIATLLPRAGRRVKNPLYNRWIEVISGMTLLGLGVRLALEER